LKNPNGWRRAPVRKQVEPFSLFSLFQRETSAIGRQLSGGNAGSAPLEDGKKQRRVWLFLR
jgi:hypothetical protein